MNNVIIKMLEPDEFFILDAFCESENLPTLKPEWSKVVAAIDTKSEKVVGIVVCQMQIHTEPIWIQKEYQGKGLWELMVDAMELYLETRAWGSGEKVGVWNQPTNAAAERICRLRGYVQGERPLWYKVYDGSTLGRILESWQQRQDHSSESEVPS